MKLILASQSPRRKELLKLAGFDFEIITTGIDESINPEWVLDKVPEILARKKAEAITEKINYQNEAVVISADTIVVFKNKVFNKPVNNIEALHMLNALNGNEHEVITGVCIKKGSRIELFGERTKVYFNNISIGDLNFYIENFQPLDKAGGYGIQDWIGLRIVKKIEGCYFNVMGLPISKTISALKRFGISGYYK